MHVLAHGGHSHGPDPAVVGLLVALIVLSVLPAATAVRQARSRREKLRVGGDEGV